MGFATVAAGYWEATSSGHSSGGCGAAKTTTQLKPPTILNPGIYAAWNFRSAAQYPAIKADWDGDGTTTCAVYAQSATDYASDGDGLIEVSNLDQLNAIRHDLDGGAAVADCDAQEYETAFPAAKGGMGCKEDAATDPEKVCIGCELSADPDFDGDGDVDINDHTGAYWHGGTGWTPIGGYVAAEFEGNGNAIGNTLINDLTIMEGGLFASTSGGSTFRRVRLSGGSISAAGGAALSGSNNGIIEYSHASVDVDSATNSGGWRGAVARRRHHQPQPCHWRRPGAMLWGGGQPVAQKGACGPAKDNPIASIPANAVWQRASPIGTAPISAPVVNDEVSGGDDASAPPRRVPMNVGRSETAWRADA